MALELTKEEAISIIAVLHTTVHELKGFVAEHSESEGKDSNMGLIIEYDKTMVREYEALIEKIRKSI